MSAPNIGSSSSGGTSTPVAILQSTSVTSAPLTTNFKINWTIGQFSSFKNATETIRLKSDSVSCKDLACNEVEDSWRLELHIKRKADAAPAAVKALGLGLYLMRSTSRPTNPVDVKCTFTIASSSHTVVFNKTYVGDQLSWGFLEFLTHGEMFDPPQRHLTADALTIRAEVALTLGVHRIVNAWSRVKRPRADNLEKDLAALLDSKTDCDFLLIASDGQEFPVHRLILRMRSEVFAAMLKPNTIEAQNGRCIISDVDGATLKALLDFIYTGTSDSVPEMAENLLIVADKYALSALTEICTAHLLDNLTSDNAGKLLIFADKYGFEQLKKFVCQFLRISAF